MEGLINAIQDCVMKACGSLATLNLDFKVDLLIVCRRDFLLYLVSQ